MIQFVLLALFVVQAAGDSCIPKMVSDIEPLPPVSVERVTSAASALNPSLSSDESILAAISMNSPSFTPVESEIESYVRSHLSTVILMESYASSPSVVTSPTLEASLRSKFPTLASAVSALVSAEETHPSLSAIQSSFQDVMVAYPTIVTAASISFSFSHASLISDEKSISEVEVSQPSIVTDVEVITTIISLSPSLSTYLTDLEVVASEYPTALHELTTARDWTDTDAWYIDTTLKSIESCYPTLYSAVHYFDTFLASHSSDTTAFTSVVTALTRVSSIVTDVTDFETSVSTSFTEAVASLSPAMHVDTEITTEITYVDVLEASHPSLSCAESTLEREVVSQPSVVYDIEVAISSPSVVTDITYVDSLEDRYPSIVSAYDAVVSVESSHPSFSYVQSALLSDEQVVTDLLTVASEVISGTSPTLLKDEYSIQKVEYVAPSISEALHSLSIIVEASPTLSCAESVLAYYASAYPTVIYTIAEAVNSPSSVAPSSIAYIAELTASYPGLASALRTIASIESTIPALDTVQSQISFAITYAPSLISVYESLASYEAVVSQEVCSFAPSTSVEAAFSS